MTSKYSQRCEGKHLLSLRSFPPSLINYDFFQRLSYDHHERSSHHCRVRKRTESVSQHKLNSSYFSPAPASWASAVPYSCLNPTIASQSSLEISLATHISTMPRHGPVPIFAHPPQKRQRSNSNNSSCETHTASLRDWQRIIRTLV